jgi:hypothetical protein
VSVGGFSVSINGDAISYGSASTRSRIPSANESPERALRVVEDPAHRTATLFCRTAPGRAIAVQVVKADGTLVQTLRGTSTAEGLCAIVWDGRDMNRRAVAAGAYIVRLYGSTALERRAVLLW